LLSFRTNTAVGKPRSGCEFLAMKRLKFAYKSATQYSHNEFTNSLNDALLDKYMDSFWRTWRSKFCSNNNRATVIDGCTDSWILPINLLQCFSQRECPILIHVTMN